MGLVRDWGWGGKVREWGSGEGMGGFLEHGTGSVRVGRWEG